MNVFDDKLEFDCLLIKVYSMEIVSNATLVSLGCISLISYLLQIILIDYSGWLVICVLANVD